MLTELRRLWVIGGGCSQAQYLVSTAQLAEGFVDQELPLGTFLGGAGSVEAIFYFGY